MPVALSLLVVLVVRNYAQTLSVCLMSRRCLCQCPGPSGRGSRGAGRRGSSQGQGGDARRECAQPIPGEEPGLIRMGHETLRNPLRALLSGLFFHPHAGRGVTTQTLVSAKAHSSFALAGVRASSRGTVSHGNDPGPRLVLQARSTLLDPVPELLTGDFRLCEITFPAGSTLPPH